MPTATECFHSLLVRVLVPLPGASIATILCGFLLSVPTIFTTVFGRPTTHRHDAALPYTALYTSPTPTDAATAL